MFRLSLAHVLAHRARLALTLLAVVLGVTFVAGSLVLTDTSQKVFDDQFRRASAGFDLSVRDAAAFDSAMGVEVDRDPLPAGLVQRVAATSGVAAVQPVVKGQGLLATSDGPIVPSGPSIVTSWAPAPFGAFTIRTGRAPQAPEDLVIDAATASAHHIAIGDRVSVVSHHTEQLRVVGLAGFGGSDGLPNTTVALVGLPTAQRLLNLGHGLSEISVVADRTTAVPELRSRLADALGAEYEVAASQDAAAASAAAAKDRLAYLRTMLLILAGAALLVGAFLIANTFRIVVGQRTRELALLRAAGATGRQVIGSVLGEAALVGVAGSVAGTALGIASATGLRDLTAAFGMAMPSGNIVVNPRTVVISVLLGVAVTVLAALGPARRAARVAPVQAIAAADPGRGTSRIRFAAGVVFLGLGMAATALVIAGAPVMLMVVTGVGVLVGITVLSPMLAPMLARLVGRPLLRAGVPGRLARESAARAPRRTAATAMALAIGLALVSFMMVLGSSAKASVRGTYAEVITADFVLESARGEMLGGLTPQVQADIAGLPEVATASTVRFGHWKDGDSISALSAIDPDTIGDVARLRMRAGGLSDLNGGGVVVAADVAASRHLRIGDDIAMTFSRRGTQHLEVVGIMDDADARALSTSYIISLDTFSRLYSETMAGAIYIKTAAGVAPAAADRALKAALAGQPTVAVRDQAAAIAARNASVDQVLGLVTVLLLFAVLIALLGITNTMALSILERTREIGLLRAVGMSRRQLQWMIRAESALIAAIAVVLGLGLGTVLGVITVPALDRNAGIPLDLPYARLALIVAVTTVAGIVAGMLPARRAARMDVLAAIATH